MCVLKCASWWSQRRQQQHRHQGENYFFARHDVLTTMLITIQIFWNMTPFKLVNSYRFLKELHVSMFGMVNEGSWRWRSQASPKCRYLHKTIQADICYNTGLHIGYNKTNEQRLDVNEKQHFFFFFLLWCEKYISTNSLGRGIPFLQFTKQDRQCTYNVNLWRVRVTSVAVGKQ